MGALHPPARHVYGVPPAVMEAPQTRAGRRGLRLGSSRLGTACLKSTTQELHIGARVTIRAVERQSDSERGERFLVHFRLETSQSVTASHVPSTGQLKPLRVFVIFYWTEPVFGQTIRLLRDSK